MNENQVVQQRTLLKTHCWARIKFSQAESKMSLKKILTIEIRRVSTVLLYVSGCWWERETDD